jgi:hypothetical protein
MLTATPYRESELAGLTRALRLDRQSRALRRARRRVRARERFERETLPAVLQQLERQWGELQPFTHGSFLDELAWAVNDLRPQGHASARATPAYGGGAADPEGVAACCVRARPQLLPVVRLAGTAERKRRGAAGRDARGASPPPVLDARPRRSRGRVRLAQDREPPDTLQRLQSGEAAEPARGGVGSQVALAAFSPAATPLPAQQTFDEPGPDYPAGAGLVLALSSPLRLRAPASRAARR